MSTISLLHLTCHDPQESGGDEIYFKFHDNGGSGNGTSSTFSGMDAGDYRDISGSFSFYGSVTVTMYEEDTIFDDRIQSLTLSTPGYHSVNFGESGMSYTLDYVIS